MLSRAFARAVPRTTSRIATTSLRPAFTSSTRSQISSISRQAPRIAAFSTSQWRKDEHAQHLAAKIDGEINIETSESEAQAGSDENVKRFQDDNPWWTIQDTLGEQDVYFKRDFEDEKITVHFSIADFDNQYGESPDGDSALGDEYDGMEDGQSGGANSKDAINQGRRGDQNFKVAPEDSVAPADREELADEEDQPQPFPVTVSVLVQRQNKGALKFILVAQDGDFEIIQMQQLPKDLKIQNINEIIRNTPEHLYLGPPFQQLDEEVQGIVESYLNARGVTEYLAQVIPDYIDVKEQKEYLGWLNRVKDFVE
ncbi:uncharacterized protein MYCFIDRAFT_87298 [Pseudocercospora fijiensis CIRAD86]|uniref:Mitochondrial glyco protein n=1 Tax=Pseudocercospora fijiensis (strain CIRAD86) TaxID=383855 RepID=M2YK30_PSEFD|nr:uncharacterized protein MYCFIDRAFT_87298 [Pseudocercospora fijiensis CIRAD86]EME78120.1 hypothetical protein MYCFIDRAFT_87298 [Pseudocercospora fijiensis CIRAD86]